MHHVTEMHVQVCLCVRSKEDVMEFSKCSVCNKAVHKVSKLEVIAEWT